MKTRLKVGAGIVALFALGSWWIGTRNPAALSQKLGQAILERRDSAEVKWLLSHGANPNTKVTRWPLSLQERRQHFLAGTTEPDESTPVLYLACSNADSVVVELLLGYGADPNRKSNDGEPPLVAAARTGSSTVVRLLLEHGSDPNGQNYSGATPLMAATSCQRPAVIALLKQAGAKENVNELSATESKTP